MVALSPWVDGAGERGQVAHMVQHVLLLSVAGPLLGAALPRRRRGGLLASAIAAAALPLVVIAWHAPAIYQAALRTPALHGAEHGAFLGAATAFWWTVLSPRRGEHVLAVFIAALPVAALGFGMTLSRTRWYPAYAEPLSRQQIAGAVMWGTGGALTVVAGAALFYAWLRNSTRNSSAAARSVQSFQANAPSANGNTTTATRNVHVTGSIDTPNFWA